LRIRQTLQRCDSIGLQPRQAFGNHIPYDGHVDLVIAMASNSQFGFVVDFRGFFPGLAVLVRSGNGLRAAEAVAW
jgi:hypothetical protein